MESSRDVELAATLSALRPAPRPAFAAELDERVAAGFPRRSAPGESLLAQATARLRGLSLRRALLPAGALAMSALVIAVALVAINHTGSRVNSDSVVATAESETSAAGRSAPPATQATANHLHGYSLPHAESSTSASSAVGGGNAASTEFEAEVPTAAPEGQFFDGSGSYLTAKSPLVHVAHRDVERSAQMVLGADPAEVGDDAAKVFAAVHTAGGIVLNSSVHDGSGEFAPGANFDLLIPSAKLGDALGAFSQIAEVRYRREATADITAPTIGTSERLQDSNAKVESLLTQLAAAESDGEREAVEAQLATERRHAASLRSRLTMLQRRANFSHVSLRIKTGESAAPSSSGGGWSIGDALHDAGHILAVAAGVAIIALAILGPLALIGLAIWLANRAWVRRSRQRALG